MLYLKEIGIGIAAVAAITGGSITIASENNRHKLNKICSSINLNELPGYFIEIDDYDPLEYHINETVFRQEIAEYMATFHKNVKYNYKVKNDSVKMKLKYKGKSKSKVFNLKINS